MFYACFKNKYDSLQIFEIFLPVFVGYVEFFHIDISYIMKNRAFKFIIAKFCIYLFCMLLWNLFL